MKEHLVMIRSCDFIRHYFLNTAKTESNYNDTEYRKVSSLRAEGRARCGKQQKIVTNITMSKNQ